MRIRPIELRKIGLKHKFTGAVIVVVAIVLAVISAAFMVAEVRSYFGAVEESVRAQASMAAFTTTAPLMFEDTDAAAKELAAFSLNKNVLSAAVIGKDGGVFASYFRDGVARPIPEIEPFSPESFRSNHYFTATALLVFQVIAHENDPLGILFIEYDTSDLYEDLRAKAVAVGIVFVFAIALAFLIGSVLQRFLLRSLHDLLDTTRAISVANDYSLRAHKASYDEIGSLVDCFNEMLDQIEIRDKHLESTVKDRTLELERTIAALAESQQKAIQAQSELSAIFGAFPDLFFRLDHSGTILAYQGGAGESPFPEQIVGDRVSSLVSADAARRFESAIKQVVRTGDLETFEFSAGESADTKIFETRIISLPLDHQVLAILRDVTDRKNNERMRDEALELSRVKSQFVANMSHEIRTPLNGILGILQLLQSTGMPTEQQVYLSMAKDSAESLMYIVNDVLDIAKIEAGKLSVSPTPFSPRETIKAALKTVALRAHQKGLELVCDIERSVPSELVGDSHRIKQILINLIGNSIKFTDRGEIVLQVRRASTKLGECELAFSVRDTGVGIPDDVRGDIFEAFVQADVSNTRSYGGTGLGLKICRQLVQMMGGEISCRGNDPQGTIFDFTLNLGCSERLTVSRTSRRLGGTSAVLVYPNAESRSVLERYLTELGIRCVAAGSVSEAATRLSDASSTDWLLVEGNAFLAQSHDLMSVPAIASSKVVALCSTHQPGQEMILRELGAAAVLLVPLLSDDISECLTELIQTRNGDGRPATELFTANGHASSRRPLNILLVEDIRINQAVMQGMLGQHGHQVTIANNGKEALDRMGLGDGPARRQDERPFDLVLMDIQMPVMDGIQAVTIIREHEKTLRAENPTAKRVPIIALTACAMQGDRERYLGCGMDGYVSKPVEMTDLLRVMQGVLSNCCGEWEHQGLAPEMASLVQRFNAVELGLRDKRPDKSLESEKIFDLDLLMRRFDGAFDIVHEIIGIFFYEHKELLSALQQCVSGDDPEAVAFQAHALKGSLKNIAAPLASRFAEEIERAARAGEISSAPALYTLLSQEVNLLKTLLSRIAQDPDSIAIVSRLAHSAGAEKEPASA